MKTANEEVTHLHVATEETAPRPSSRSKNKPRRVWMRKWSHPRTTVKPATPAPGDWLGVATTGGDPVLAVRWRSPLLREGADALDKPFV